MKLALGLIISACLYSIVASDAQVDALFQMKLQLKASASQLINWNANQVSPCYWTYVNCDSNGLVTVLTLASMGFTGTLSPSIGILTSLQTLALQDNYMTGGIPEGYGNLSSLVSLQLENNRLSGEIPSSLGNLSKLHILDLSQNSFNGNIPDSFSSLMNLVHVNLSLNNLIGSIPTWLFQVRQYNFTGNNLNCGENFSTPCLSGTGQAGGSVNSTVAVAVGSTSAVIFLLLLVVAYLLWRKGICCRHETFVDVPGEDDQKLSFGQLKRFAWRELQIATDDFNEDNVLGQGGFGKVYKGVLPNGTKVAVKRLIDHGNVRGEAGFLCEIRFISVAVHKNILKLIGFCTTSAERLLVYPFMPNLSVAHRLREFKPNEPALDWVTRRRVALGTARGLEYLHEHCNPKIIHRDVKAANVLLDENFEAVVCDFGLAKLVDVRVTSVTTNVCGTMGHIAPEYLSTGRSSERTDIFGYGVLLLELLTGQRAIDSCRLEGEDDVLLIDHVKRRLEQNQVEAIMDRNLLDGNYDVQDVQKMLQIALLCTDASPEDRPAMSEVVRMLEGEVPAERWEEWQQAEVARRQNYETMQRNFGWGEGSISIQDAIELSSAR